MEYKTSLLQWQRHKFASVKGYRLIDVTTHRIVGSLLHKEDQGFWYLIYNPKKKDLFPEVMESFLTDAAAMNWFENDYGAQVKIDILDEGKVPT